MPTLEPQRASECPRQQKPCVAELAKKAIQDDRGLGPQISGPLSP